MKQYSYIGSVCTGIFTAIQTNKVYEIIGLVLTIASFLLSFAFSIYQFYKEAKKDGKIDFKEAQEGIDLINEKVEESKAILKDFEEKTKRK